MMQNQFNGNEIAVDASTNVTTTYAFESIPFLDEGRFYKHVGNLTKNQKGFIDLLNSWFKSRRYDIIIISGSPGSGKTYAVIETLKYIDANILRMAYTARLAYKIGGSTIHSTMKLSFGKLSALCDIEESINEIDETDKEYVKKCLNISKNLQKYLIYSENPDIVVIDEIGMIPFWFTLELIKFFSKRPILIILMGDQYQLKPVKCNLNIFDMQISCIKVLYFDDNKRFTLSYKKNIDDIKSIIEKNYSENIVTYLENNFPIIEDVTENLLKRCNRVLVYKKESVKKYNAFYVEHFPGSIIMFPTVINKEIDTKDCIILKNNINIIITKNCEVSNGTELIFVSYNKHNDQLVCKCPNTNHYFTITRDKYSGQFPVMLAFACTIHKYQGETINDSNILFDFDYNLDLHLIYTALSRVKSKDQILGITRIKA